MVTKNYHKASRNIRAAITESFEDMMTDFISLLCIFVCRRLFLGHFASDMRTSMARTVHAYTYMYIYIYDQVGDQCHQKCDIGEFQALTLKLQYVPMKFACHWQNVPEKAFYIQIYRAMI